MLKSWDELGSDKEPHSNRQFRTKTIKVTPIQKTLIEFSIVTWVDGDTHFQYWRWCVVDDKRIKKKNEISESETKIRQQNRSDDNDDVVDRKLKRNNARLTFIRFQVISSNDCSIERQKKEEKKTLSFCVSFCLSLHTPFLLMHFSSLSLVIFFDVRSCVVSSSVFLFMTFLCTALSNSHKTMTTAQRKKKK